MNPEENRQPSRFTLSPIWLWGAAGGLLLSGIATMSLVSDQLSPIVSPQDRPLQWYVVFYVWSWLGFALAYRLISGTVTRCPLWWILAVGLLARVLFLPSSWIQSDDAYRYVLDGQSLLRGINPYQFSPAQWQSSASPEFLMDDPSSASDLIARVNHPDVPTIYPPLALAAFATGAALTPWELDGQRWVFLLCDLATIALLLGILRAEGKPLGWICLYAWNPLVIKEISNTAHMDSLVALWLVVLVAVLSSASRAAASIDSPWRSFTRSALVGLVMGGAILTKLYPIILLPCCIAVVARTRKKVIDVATMLSATVCVVILCYKPFMGVGWGRMSEGLRTYSEHWMNNPGAFALLKQLSASPRSLAAAIVIAVSLWTATTLWRSQRRSGDIVGAMQRVLLTWLLLAPACFPWYAVGLLAVSVLRPRGWSVVLTGAFGLFYLLLHFDYQGHPASWQSALRLIEHGAIWLWLVIAAIWQFFAIRRGPE